MFDIRSWLLGYPFRRSVIVVTRTDRSFRGVLWDQTADHIVLRGVESLVKRAEPVPLVGELVIPRANVDYLQVVEPS